MFGFIGHFSKKLDILRNGIEGIFSKQWRQPLQPSPAHNQPCNQSFLSYSPLSIRP